MSQAPQSLDQTSQITRLLADYTMGFKFDGLPEDAVEAAKHCLLDWFGVTIAGCSEPLTKILIDQAMADGANGQATIVGDGRKVSTSQAALINGTASHALDYDDVHKRLRGHPTIPVAPVVLALAEHLGASGKDTLTSFVAGVEAECRIGAYVGSSHYDKGWHSTATLGTFGAAVAAARMLGLDGDRCAVAMGIAGTQAAGLRSMFGTMCKPLHAGKAAQNGLFAAQLAARGFTSRQDILEGELRFAHTQSEAPDIPLALEGMGEQFEVRNALFKYHAACYGAHATIEAVRTIQDKAHIEAANIERVEIAIRSVYISACGNPAPTTGLEGKFSLAFCVALTIAGRDTARIDTYSDQSVRDPELLELMRKVTVTPNEAQGQMTAEVTIHTKDNVVHRQAYDVGVPAKDLGQQWEKLTAKFRACSEPVIGGEKSGKLIEKIEALDTLEDMPALMALSC